MNRELKFIEDKLFDNCNSLLSYCIEHNLDDDIQNNIKNSCYDLSSLIQFIDRKCNE